MRKVSKGLLLFVMAIAATAFGQAYDYSTIQELFGDAPPPELRNFYETSRQELLDLNPDIDATLQETVSALLEIVQQPLSEEQREMIASACADHPLVAVIDGFDGAPDIGGGGGEGFTTYDFAPPDPSTGVPAVGIAEVARSVVILDDFDQSGLTPSLLGALDLGSKADLWTALITAFHSPSPPNPPSPPIPHGHLVLFHTLAMLIDGEVGMTYSGEVPGLSNVHRFDLDGTGRSLYLVDFDYASFASLQAAMTFLIDDLSQQEPIVVNASWGLRPCRLAGSVELSEFGSLVESIIDRFNTDPSSFEPIRMLCEALLVATDCSTPQEIVTFSLSAADAVAQRAFFENNLPLPGDPLLFVASTGNQGLAFPMPPADWPGFVGVAACVPGSNGAKADWSNASLSGVVTLGGRFAIPAGAVPAFAAKWLNPPTVGPLGWGYYGTSHAAPFYALTGQDHCP